MFPNEITLGWIRHPHCTKAIPNPTSSPTPNAVPHLYDLIKSESVSWLFMALNNYYVGITTDATGRMTPSEQMSADDDTIKNKNKLLLYYHGQLGLAGLGLAWIGLASVGVAALRSSRIQSWWSIILWHNNGMSKRMIMVLKCVAERIQAVAMQLDYLTNFPCSN